MAVVQQIVNAIAPSDRDHVVEIGPGMGALTEFLLKMDPGMGVLTQALLPEVAFLDAVELDRDLVAKLESSSLLLGNFAIHSADALKFDFCTLRRNNESLRLVGNLPYNISTPLMFQLFKQVDCIADMHFMLQKEVVDRLVAEPGSRAYGKLGIMVQYKTLHNNLKSLLNDEQIKSVDIDPSRRAETLSLVEFAALSNLLSDQA